MGILNQRLPLFLCGRLLALGALSLAATSCVPTFDDNLPLITEPTLLAVHSEPAEVAPGETVQLTASVASADPNAAAPTLSWGLCLARKPLTELGPVNPSCIQPPTPSEPLIVDLGQGASVEATLPSDACRLFGPSLPEPMNGEPAGRPVDPDPSGGFYQPIGVTLRSRGVTSLGAVRILCPPAGLDQQQARDFNLNYRRNENPALEAVAWQGDDGQSHDLVDEPASTPVNVGQKLSLRASWTTCPAAASCGDGVCSAQEDKDNCSEDCTAAHGCSGAESYAWFNPESRTLEVRHESIRISWYASAGRFENAVTGRDESEFTISTAFDSWTAPSKAGTVRLWAVIRDDRGGQSVRSFLLEVAPKR